MSEEPINGEIIPAGAIAPRVTMTEAIFEAILEDISEGIPLRQICRRPDRPSKSEYYRYRDGCDLAADVENRDTIISGRLARVAKARLDGFDALSEETLDIADDGTNDWIERERQDGSTYEALNGEHVQRSKLRVETRLKLLAVWDPKRYGPRVDHTSSDGSMTPRGLGDFYGDDEPKK